MLQRFIYKHIKQYQSNIKYSKIVFFDELSLREFNFVKSHKYRIQNIKKRVLNVHRLLK